MLKKIIIPFCLAVITVLWWFSGQPSGTGEGTTVPVLSEPLQGKPAGRDELTFGFSRGGYDWQFTPLATYAISARVLHAKRYRFGWQKILSPVDFALGWGEFQDPKVDKWIKWSQSGRWYYYRWKGGCPYPPAFIIGHSANVHIIPATDNLWKAVLKVDPNALVYMEGLLVGIRGDKGNSWVTWSSSLSRNDSGDGSCEVLYVEKLVLNGKTYI